MQPTNCHHSRAQSRSSSAGLKRRNLSDALARKCLIAGLVVFVLSASQSSRAILFEISNGGKPLENLNDFQTNSELVQELNRNTSSRSERTKPSVENAQNQTNLSGQQQRQPDLVASNSSAPVISKPNEDSTGAEVEPDEKPGQQRRTQLNQSNVRSTGPPLVGSLFASHEEAPTLSSHETDFLSLDEDQRQTNGLELEPRGQQTSRLLLQLLVLGFFVLLSISLIVVYSIKFCVCRRRKERRLLRRALIGDLTSSTRSLSHHLPISHQGNQLACPHQPVGGGCGASSLLSVAQLNGLECRAAQTNECSACSQWRRSFLSNFNLENGANLYQLEPSSSRRLSRTCAGLEPNQMYDTQPQLLLALLERLQQLLIGSDTTTTASSATAARRTPQLGHLIAAQIDSLPAPHSNPSVSLAGQSASGVCACQQFHLAPTSPMSLSSSRPPAYSELFLVNGGGGEGDVTHEQLARRQQAGEHEREDSQREGLQQQTNGGEREHEQQEAVVSLSGESYDARGSNADN